MLPTVLYLNVSDVAKGWQPGPNLTYARQYVSAICAAELNTICVIGGFSSQGMECLNFSDPLWRVFPGMRVGRVSAGAVYVNGVSLFLIRSDGCALCMERRYNFRHGRPNL